MDTPRARLARKAGRILQEDEEPLLAADDEVEGAVLVEVTRLELAARARLVAAEVIPMRPLHRT